MEARLSVAQRYHVRSPRYVLMADDLRLMRFAPMQTKGVIYSTQVSDLSETGLAFTLEAHEAPEEGDMLKIEFTVPGRKQIACFATVVRVDRMTDWSPDFGDRNYRLIGLQFRNLPEAHRRALRLGLEGRASEEVFQNWSAVRRKQIWSFSGVCLAACASLFVLAHPPEAWLAPLRSLLMKMAF